VRAKNYMSAAEEFEQAIAFAPSYADIRCKYGKVLLELNKPEEAADQFRKAIQINERYVDAHAHLGIALARIGREMEAGDSFQQALVLDPYHPVATVEAGKLPARRSMR